MIHSNFDTLLTDADHLPHGVPHGVPLAKKKKKKKKKKNSSSLEFSKKVLKVAQSLLSNRDRLGFTGHNMDPEDVARPAPLGTKC